MFQDKTDDAKKARKDKEENGAGSAGEEVEEEEEDYDEDIPEGFDEEIEGDGKIFHILSKKKSVVLL